MVRAQGYTREFTEINVDHIKFLDTTSDKNLLTETMEIDREDWPSERTFKDTPWEIPESTMDDIPF